MRAVLLLPLLLCLTGCNWFNHVTGLSKDSDKAIGAACRQTGRSLEECYLRNPDADRAQVFSGWREMHEYMVKQQLPTMAPPLVAVPVPAAVASAPAPAQKTSDNASSNNDEQNVVRQANASPEVGKADPEVQAVLDTINNRPHANAAAQPSASEQEKLQQVLAGSNKPAVSPDAAAPPSHAKKKKG
jgi:hypothetical protein